MSIDVDELNYMLGWGDFPQPKAKIIDDEISSNVDVIPSVQQLSSDVYHEDKIAKVLNKYFGNNWVEYSIEENILNRISTEITLTVVFKNNKKSNVTLPAVLL